MSGMFDRAYEVHSAAMAAFMPEDPFDAPRFAWRMSPDVLGRMTDWAAKEYSWPIDPGPEAVRLLGFPVFLDDTLPPNSMLLEAVG